ncbi:hypothetical protein LCGC14_2716250 [marine sediment metagenome]|uniref:Uncharacterized protein n=1 Tax=marine sediment metagenome TaxID=412755 RepID=A0A0F9C362_9ZZZZ
MFDMTTCHAGLSRSDAVYGIHNQFDESVVIARVFLTVPYGELPNANQEFVKKLAESADVESELKPAKKNDIKQT